MKQWNKPEVREVEVGMEVTSYLPAEIDVIYKDNPGAIRGFPYTPAVNASSSSSVGTLT